jgi:Tat protein translocase TatB subunit
VFGIGMTELLVILVVGLLVLGPKRLPELARSLGKGLAEFRRASSDMRREFLDVQEDLRIDPDPDTEGGAAAEPPPEPDTPAKAPELAAASDAAGAPPKPGPDAATADPVDAEVEKAAENAGG